MARKEIKHHQKAPAGSVWHTHRLEGKIKNRGIKATKKKGQKEKK